jgi:hypothetical protein
VLHPEAVRSATNTIAVAIQMDSCNMRVDPARRFDPVEIQQTRRAVLILVLLRKERPSRGSCLGTGIEFRRKIHLPAKIGRRSLLDARTHPPTPAMAAPKR